MTNRSFKTGESRDQAGLLPPRIEDYAGPDNPVWAIDSFVCALSLAKLGFHHADRERGLRLLLRRSGSHTRPLMLRKGASLEMTVVGCE